MGISTGINVNTNFGRGKSSTGSGMSKINSSFSFDNLTLEEQIAKSAEEKAKEEGKTKIGEDIATTISDTAKNISNSTKSELEAAGYETERTIDTIDELIDYAKEIGFNDKEIGKLSDSDSPVQTFNEILEDLYNDPKRKRIMYEEGMIKAYDADFSVEVKNLKDLKTHIGNLESEQAKLLATKKTLDLGKYKGLLSLIDKAEDGKDLDALAKKLDVNGNPIRNTPLGILETKTFYDVYKNDPEYQKLKEALDKGLDLSELIKNFRDTQRGLNEQASEIDKKLANIAEELSLANYVYEQVDIAVTHQMENIDPYIYKDDFDDKSTFNKDTLNTLDKVLDRYITKNGQVSVNDKEAADILLAIINGEGTGYNDKTIVSNNKVIEHYKKWAPNMTADEIKVANYIYNTQGASALLAFANGSMVNTMDNRWLQVKREKDANFAKANNFNKVLASLGSIVVTPAEGIVAAMHSTDVMYRKKVLKEEAKILRTDVYSSGTVWRMAVSRDILENSDLKFSKQLASAYDIGMSMADSLSLVGVNVLTGGTATPLISAALMGSRAYVSTLNDALDRGLSDGQAVALAYGSATVETLMESWSASHLFNLEKKLGIAVENIVEKSGKKFTNEAMQKIATKFTYITAGAVSQGLVEGEEELSTEVLNYVWDMFIAKDLSTYKTTIDKYTKLGYSEENAQKEALKDLEENMKQAFIGGFISGICFGLGGASKTTRRMSKMLSTEMYDKFEGKNYSEKFASALKQNREQIEVLENARKETTKANIKNAVAVINHKLKSKDGAITIPKLFNKKPQEIQKLGSDIVEIKDVNDNKLESNISNSRFTSENGYQLDVTDMGNFFQMQLNRGFFTQEQINNILADINSKGYMSTDMADKLSKLLADPEFDIYVKTIHSNDINSINQTGIYLNGNVTSGFGVAPQTIADIDLGNTVTKVEDLYTLTTILKGANGISQGGNPIDSTVVLKVPKGISIDDMVYYNGTQFSIKPDFIEEFIGTDTTGKLTELQIQNVTQPIVANNDSIKPNSVNTIIDQSMAEIIDVSTLDMTRSQGISFTKSSVNLNRSYEGYDYVIRPKASLSEVLDSLKDITDKKILIELKGVEELNPSLIENISDNISFRISNYNSNYINGENFLYTLEHLTYNAEEIKTIATKLDEIKSGIDDNWSDYQKAEYVYNYLKDNIKYNPSPGRTLERSKEHDGLNSLIVGESTCQGFAHTYRMILNSFGIECEEVWGQLKGVPDVGQHAYTVVKTGDNVFVVDPVRELLTNHPGTGFGVSFENLNNEYNQRTNNELLKKLNWENSENNTKVNEILNLDDKQFEEFINSNKDNSVYDNQEIYQKLTNYLATKKIEDQVRVLTEIGINHSLYVYVVSNQEFMDYLEELSSRIYNNKFTNFILKMNKNDMLDFLDIMNIKNVNTDTKRIILEQLSNSIDSELQTEIIFKTGIINDFNKLSEYEIKEILQTIKSSELVYDILNIEQVKKYLFIMNSSGVRPIYSIVSLLDSQNQKKYVKENNLILNSELTIREALILVTTMNGETAEETVKTYPKIIEEMDVEDLINLYDNTKNNDYLNEIKDRIARLKSSNAMHNFRLYIISNNMLDLFSENEIQQIFNVKFVDGFYDMKTYYEAATDEQTKEYLISLMNEKIEQASDNSLSISDLSYMIDILDKVHIDKMLSKIKAIDKLDFLESSNFAEVNKKLDNQQIEILIDKIDDLNIEQFIDILSRLDDAQKNKIIDKTESISWFSFEKIYQKLNDTQINKLIDKLESNIFIYDLIVNNKTTLSNDQINQILNKVNLVELISYIDNNQVYDVLLTKLKENPDSIPYYELSSCRIPSSDTAIARFKEILPLLDDVRKLKIFNYNTMKIGEYVTEVRDIINKNPELIKQMNFSYTGEFLQLLSEEEVITVVNELNADEISEIIKGYSYKGNIPDNIKKTIIDTLISKSNTLEATHLPNVLELLDEESQIRLLERIEKFDIDDVAYRINNLIKECKTETAKSLIFSKINVGNNKYTLLAMTSQMDTETIQIFKENCSNYMLLQLYSMNADQEFEVEIMNRFKANPDLFISLNNDTFIQLLDNLSKDNRQIIEKQVNNFFENIENQKIKELYTEASTIEKYRLYSYIEKGNSLTNEQIEFLKELKEKNRFVLSTFNYAIFDPSIYKLDKKLLTKLSKYYNIVTEMQKLSTKSQKFDLFISLIKADDSSSSLVSDHKMALLLKYISENDIYEKLLNASSEEELKVARNIILKQIDFLASTDTARKSEEINRNLITIDNYTLDNYQEELNKACDNLFENATTIEEVQNLIFNKYFSITVEDAMEIYRMYGSHYNLEVSKYDDTGIVTKYLSLMKTVMNISDVSAAKEMYQALNTENISYNMDDTLSIINDIKKIYTRSLKNTLFNPTEVTGYVEYDGKRIPIYEPQGDFQMIIQSTYTDYGGMPMINDDYFDSWNLSSRTANHGICCSVISNNNMGMAAVKEHGIVIGFNSFSDEQVNMMAPYDIYTANDGYIITHWKPLIFISGEEIANETRHTHNELNLERANLTGEGNLANIQPDYVVVFEEMDDYQKQNAYKASIEFNVPLVYINKGKMAQQASAKIDSLISEYQSTKDAKLLKEILVLHENNVNGYGNPTDQTFIDKYFPTDRISGILESAIAETTNKEDLKFIKDFLADEVRKFAYEDPNKERSHKLDIDVEDLNEKIDNKISEILHNENTMNAIQDNNLIGFKEGMAPRNIADYYVNNLEKLLNKGVNIEQLFFEMTGQKVLSAETRVEAGLILEDPNIEMFSILNRSLNTFNINKKALKEIDDTMELVYEQSFDKIDIDEISLQIKRSLRKYGMSEEQIDKYWNIFKYKVRFYNIIDSNEMYKSLEEYMIDDEKQRLSEMLAKSDSYVETMKKNITNDQHNAIYVYTKQGPGVFNAILISDPNYKGLGRTYRTKGITPEKMIRSEYTEALGSEVDVGDNLEALRQFVINNKIDKTMKVYRMVKDFGGKRKIKDLKVGAQFMNEGFTSSTVSLEDYLNMFPKNKSTDILLEIIVPEGSDAAFIEPFSGTSEYFQDEMVLGPNSTLTIIEDAIDRKFETKYGKKIVRVVKCILTQG